VGEAVGKIDKPEPRWQALLALLAVGGIYLALPRSLVVGPTWLLPVLILILTAPTVIAHRMGRRSLNRVLGIAISSIITLALIASVSLLVLAVPAHKESPLELLCSGAELWLTNVLVFAVWYWRLDGGGPTKRHELREFGSRSFVFPQMQIEKIERGRFECQGWRPNYRLDHQFDVWSDRRALACPLGKDSYHGPNRNFINYCDCFDFARGRSALGFLPMLPFCLDLLEQLGVSSFQIVSEFHPFFQSFGINIETFL